MPDHPEALPEVRIADALATFDAEHEVLVHEVVVESSEGDFTFDVFAELDDARQVKAKLDEMFSIVLSQAGDLQLTASEHLALAAKAMTEEEREELVEVVSSQLEHEYDCRWESTLGQAAERVIETVFAALPAGQPKPDVLFVPAAERDSLAEALRQIDRWANSDYGDHLENRMSLIREATRTALQSVEGR